MGLTTPNMGLKEWNLGGDFFSFADLAANWDAVDAHDHTSGKGVLIPTAGIANSAVTTAKIGASQVDDTKLASPTNPVWRTMWSANINHGPPGTGTFALGGPSLVPSGTAVTSPILIIPWILTNYSVPNKATSLRIIVGGATNATAPTTSFTFGMHSITNSVGGSGQIQFVFNITQVTGSGVTITTPAASSRFSQIGSAFTAPADGQYALCVTPTAGTVAGAYMVWSVHLQISHT